MRRKGVGGQSFREITEDQGHAPAAAPPLNRLLPLGWGGEERGQDAVTSLPSADLMWTGVTGSCEAEGGFPPWGPLGLPGATPGPQCPGPRAASAISLLLTKPENTELAAHLVRGKAGALTPSWVE